MRHANHAQLHAVSPALTACVHMAVERDTRGAYLDHDGRHNYLPASPLPTLSWVFHGQLLQLTLGETLAETDRLSPLDAFTIAGPQRRPMTSWSPGAVHALTVAFYPDAMQRLFGIDMVALKDRVLPARSVLSQPWLDLLSDVTSFEQLQLVLHPRWQALRLGRGQLLGDWLLSLTSRAAQTQAGRGLRQIQRRIKSWTGLSQRDIDQLARVEAAFVVATQTPEMEMRLATIAADAGYSDQSHLGRSVRRVTGLSPADFEARLSNDPSFWLYRLLKEHHMTQTDNALD